MSLHVGRRRGASMEKYSRSGNHSLRGQNGAIKVRTVPCDACSLKRSFLILRRAEIILIEEESSRRPGPGILEQGDVILNPVVLTDGEQVYGKHASQFPQGPTHL